MGVSPRRLWGWEPAEFHEFVVEGGRRVGVKVTREPEYTPEDVALLLAHLRNEADKGSHGIPMSEATDPKNQFGFKASQQPSMDWAAKALGDAQDLYYKNNKDAPRHGHLWSVKRRD